MRYTLRCVIIAMMVLGVAGVALSEVETLIDFSRLASDSPDSYLNSGTTLSFFDLFPTSTGVSLGEADRERLQVSLSIEEWDVVFIPSTRYPYNQQTSDVRQVTLGENATQYAGEAVMGARVNFPHGAHDAWAAIIPPYTIPRINPQLFSGRTVDYRGLGQLRNVDRIRSISANVYGLNYPYQLEVMLENQHGALDYYLVGDLNFTGWQTLTWTNPSYDQLLDVPDTEPVYPSAVRSVVFRGFRIVKKDPVNQNDFVGYFKDVIVDYDPAVTADLDIDNEAVWGLVEEAELLRRQQEFIRGGGTSIFYEYIVKQRELQYELDNN